MIVFRSLIAFSVLSSLPALAVAAQAENSFRGKIVFFGSQEGESNLIQTMNPDGSDLRTVAKLDGAVTSGRVSPDGLRLAFGFQAKGSKGPGIWVLEPNGQRRKVANLGFVTAWPPDGKRITYYWGGQRGDWENFSVDVTTGEVRRLPAPRGDVVEDWSPNGRLFAVVAGNATQTFEHATKGTYPLRQIYLIAVDGTQKRLLTSDSMHDAIWPRFSPDGARIAYYWREYPGRSQAPLEFLVVRNADSQAPKTMLSFATLSDKDVSVRPFGFPAWSPDGRTLVWAADRRRRDRRDLAPGQRIEYELVFVSTDMGQIRRHPLTQKGVTRWGTIDWR